MVWLTADGNFVVSTDDLVKIFFWASLSWATFHGHRFGKDCWLCEYRGLTISVFVVSWGIWSVIEANEED